jgi:hypothetical protein
MRVGSARGLRATSRAFTLIEIFIVGVLISLFATLAIINVQQQFEINKRKAGIGDIRQLATSMSFCYDDIAIFPKFALLDQALDEVAPVVGATRQLVPGFEYMGHPLSALETQIITNWKGPYSAASETRRKIARGGGIVDMVIPESNETVAWQADPWGNPYVLYLVYIYTDLSGRPVYDWIPDATTEPNYFCAAVSYGRNTVPGCSVDTFGQVPAAFQALAERQRLYVTLDKRLPLYRALTETDYNSERLAAISRAPLDGADGVMTGIRDVGSDDIVFEF